MRKSTRCHKCGAKSGRDYVFICREDGSNIPERRLCPKCLRKLEKWLGIKHTGDWGTTGE